MEILHYSQVKTEAILKLTLKIQAEFPGLYEHLDEAPLFISENKQCVTQNELDHYYESLKAQASKFVISRNWC